MTEEIGPIGYFRFQSMQLFGIAAYAEVKVILDKSIRRPRFLPPAQNGSQHYDKTVSRTSFKMPLIYLFSNLSGAIPSPAPVKSAKCRNRTNLQSSTATVNRRQTTNK